MFNNYDFRSILSGLGLLGSLILAPVGPSWASCTSALDSQKSPNTTKTFSGLAHAFPDEFHIYREFTKIEDPVLRLIYTDGSANFSLMRRPFEQVEIKVASYDDLSGAEQITFQQSILSDGWKNLNSVDFPINPLNQDFDSPYLPNTETPLSTRKIKGYLSASPSVYVYTPELNQFYSFKAPTDSLDYYHWRIGQDRLHPELEAYQPDKFNRGSAIRKNQWLNQWLKIIPGNSRRAQASSNTQLLFDSFASVDTDNRNGVLFRDLSPLLTASQSGSYLLDGKSFGVIGPFIAARNGLSYEDLLMLVTENYARFIVDVFLDLGLMPMTPHGQNLIFKTDSTGLPKGGIFWRDNADSEIHHIAANAFAMINGNNTPIETMQTAHALNRVDPKTRKEYLLLGQLAAYVTRFFNLNPIHEASITPGLQNRLDRHFAETSIKYLGRKLHWSSTHISQFLSGELETLPQKLQDYLNSDAGLKDYVGYHKRKNGLREI